MGAWGNGFFEDDTACDIAAEIAESDDPRAFFVNAFDTAINSDGDMEYDECQAALMSAVFIDILCNATQYEKAFLCDDGNQTGNYVDGMEFFLAKNKSLQISDLKKKAVKALEYVLHEDSELYGLWNENEESGPEWRRSIDELIERLK